MEIKKDITLEQFKETELKQEMFSNELEHPKKVNHQPKDHKEDCECCNCNDGALERHNEYFKKWQEAEKKVIFKGWKGKKNTYTYKNWCIQFGSDLIFLLYETSNSSTSFFYIKTVGDLFKATGGEIETNVNCTNL